MNNKHDHDHFSLIRIHTNATLRGNKDKVFKYEISNKVYNILVSNNDCLNRYVEKIHIKIKCEDNNIVRRNGIL